MGNRHELYHLPGSRSGDTSTPMCFGVLAGNLKDIRSVVGDSCSVLEEYSQRVCRVLAACFGGFPLHVSKFIAACFRASRLVSGGARCFRKSLQCVFVSVRNMFPWILPSFERGTGYSQKTWSF